ncbi:MAG TPA: hypothetical protein VJB94_00720 [Candidatus Nanoarchaeia archaeon]|nr:hypothetical protein [Candidatus Nanoarchaeia archaeon]
MKKITGHKFPYGILDFVKNTKQYGFSEALREDSWQTKRNLDEGLEKLVIGAIMVPAVAIGIGWLFYSIGKDIKRRREYKRLKLEE